jgi:hypothetical protein
MLQDKRRESALYRLYKVRVIARLLIKRQINIVYKKLYKVNTRIKNDWKVTYYEGLCEDKIENGGACRYKFQAQFLQYVPLPLYNSRN